MSKRLLYLILTVAWTVVVLLAAHAMRDVIGGRFKTDWLPITSMVLCAVTLAVFFFQWIYRLALKSMNHPVNQIAPIGSDGGNSIELVKGGPLMPDNSNPENKVLHINHGASYHLNTPGGMMNFGPVTVNQNFGTQQTDTAPAQDEPEERVAEVVCSDETIDINSLVEYSANLKSPGICSNTVRKILKDADIEPCATEKDGKVIRNLYPRKEAKGVVSDYMADKR